MIGLLELLMIHNIRRCTWTCSWRETFLECWVLLSRLSFICLKSASCNKQSLITTAQKQVSYLSTVYIRGSQTGVHVPLGVHLPICRATF